MDIQQSRMRLGWYVLAGLLALTAIEFWLAQAAYGPMPFPVLCGLLAPLTWVAIAAQAHPVPFLASLALVKAALILYYFMHVAQLWKRTEEQA